MIIPIEKQKTNQGWPVVGKVLRHLENFLFSTIKCKHVPIILLRSPNPLKL